MPGPRPKPSKLLKLSGSWREQYKRSGSEPAPEEVAPPRPAWLSPGAVEVWDSLTAVLANMGVLTIADGAMLSRYCELWVDWQDTNTFIRKNGTAYPIRHKATRGGDPGEIKCFMQFPQVGVRNQIGRELRAIECEFGLSPSARTRIDVELAGAGGKGSKDNGRTRFFSAG